MVWSIRTSLFIVSAYHYQKFINCPSPLAGYVGRLKVVRYKCNTMNTEVDLQFDYFK